jgi:ribosomal protein L24E
MNELRMREMRRIREWTQHCDACGAPILDHNGLRRVIDGQVLLFCDHQCVGMYHQLEVITV